MPSATLRHSALLGSELAASPTHWIAIGLVAAAVLGAAGCARSPERLQSQRVLDRIERMRSAAPGERDPLIAALDGEPAEHPVAKKAKHSCLQAYRSLARARRLEAEAREQMGDGAPSLEAARALLEAEAELAQATAKMPECTAAVAQLRQMLR